MMGSKQIFKTNVKLFLPRRSSETVVYIIYLNERKVGNMHDLLTTRFLTRHQYYLSTLTHTSIISQFSLDKTNFAIFPLIFFSLSLYEPSICERRMR